MWFLKAGAPKPFFVRPARIAPQIMGGNSSIVLASDTLHIVLGSIVLDVVAERAGAAYNIGAREFTWKSNDGLASGFNTQAFTNGALVDSGIGIGTVISPAPHSTPLPSNIYVEDENLSLHKNIRNGHGFYSRASFEKAHGPQPQTAQIEYSGRCTKNKGKAVFLLSGGSAWKGRIQDWQLQTNNQSGRTTIFRCVDVRDDLYNKVIFGRVNMIDERTGEVSSSVSEATLTSDFRDKLNELGYRTNNPNNTGGGRGHNRPIPGTGGNWSDLKFLGYGSSDPITGIPIAFAGYGTSDGAGFKFTYPEDLFDITKETGKIFPRDLLDWLCGICGFKTAYTPTALERLKETEFATDNDPGWKSTHWNVYNIDWSGGVKVGAAIQHVADALGLVFSPTDELKSGDFLPENNTPDDFDTIRFYVQGKTYKPQFDISYTNHYSSHNIGEAVQPEVDTGKWIVGDPDRIEFQGLKLVPAWNQRYNFLIFPGKLQYYLDLINGGKEEDEQLNPMVDTMETFAEEMLGQDAADQWDAKVDELIAQGVPEDEALQQADTFYDNYIDGNTSWEDTGFLEGKKFKDMTIDEYLNKVPYKVYRIDMMKDVLPEDEFNGTKKVSRIPIDTPLNTDPTKGYIVRGHVCKLNRKKYLNKKGLIADGPADPDNPLSKWPELRGGHKLIQSTGHVVFNKMQFELQPKDADGKADPDKDPTDFDENDVLPDTKLTIDTVFLGDEYRAFYGTDERIGTHRVSDLFRRFKVPSKKTEAEAQKIYDQTLQDKMKEYQDLPELTRLSKASQAANEAKANALNPQLQYVTVEGEKTADDIAADIANALLSRQRVVRSGGIRFDGVAGHEPDEVIRRVSVSVDPESGISENVTYSNDAPPMWVPSYYEVQNRLAMQAKIAKLELDKRKAMLATKRKLIKEAEDIQGSHEQQAILAVLQNMNKDNWMRVKINSESSDTDKAYEAGEPVVATLNDDGVYSLLKEKKSIVSGDTRLVGVSLAKTTAQSGDVPTITMGICKVRVKGKVNQGDTLAPTKEGKTFEVGYGPVTAMQTAPTPPAGEDADTYVQAILGKVGVKADAVMRVDYATTPDDLVIDESSPANPDPDRSEIPYGLYADSAGTKRITADGYNVANGDIVLLASQPAYLQGVWSVNATGEWTLVGTPTMATVGHGKTLLLTTWVYYKPWSAGGVSGTPFYRIMRAGWF